MIFLSTEEAEFMARVDRSIERTGRPYGPCDEMDRVMADRLAWVGLLREAEYDYELPGWRYEIVTAALGQAVTLR